MAFGIFLNFEKISLEIVENEIALMTDNNQTEEDLEMEIVDETSFTNNLYHGSIAIMFIVNLYETTLNTILGRRLNCSELDIFKTSHGVKLQLICAMFGIDIETIKSNDVYNKVSSAIKLRNDITHYKSNEVASGHFISMGTKVPKGTSKDAMPKMFTKTYMQELYDGVLKTLELICKKCGLVMYNDCGVIDCDGRDEACEFVITQEVYDNRRIYT